MMTMKHSTIQSYHLLVSLAYTRLDMVRYGMILGEANMCIDVIMLYACASGDVNCHIMSRHVSYLMQI